MYISTDIILNIFCLYFFNKILNKKINFAKLKTILILIFMTIVSTFINIQCPRLFKFIFSFAFMLFIIYYFVENNKIPQYDLKSFLYEQNQLGKLSDDKYNAFVAALEKCVFTSRKAQSWKTGANIDFTDFDVEDYNYGGLSITTETIEK